MYYVCFDFTTKVNKKREKNQQLLYIIFDYWFNYENISRLKKKKEMRISN